MQLDSGFISMNDMDKEKVPVDMSGKTDQGEERENDSKHCGHPENSLIRKTGNEFTGLQNPKLSNHCRESRSR